MISTGDTQQLAVMSSLGDVREEGGQMAGVVRKFA